MVPEIKNINKNKKGFGDISKGQLEGAHMPNVWQFEQENNNSNGL